VGECGWNDIGHCSKTDLQVGNPNADTPEQTECASFEKTGYNPGSMTNTAAGGLGSWAGDSTEHIGCECEHCAYNKARECNLEGITVGHSGNVGEAEYKSQTCCDSFEHR